MFNLGTSPTAIASGPTIVTFVIGTVRWLTDRRTFGRKLICAVHGLRGSAHHLLPVFSSTIQVSRPSTCGRL